MSGPWEKYGAAPAPADDGPWSKYGAPDAAPAAAPAAKPKSSLLGDIGQGLVNLGAGAVRGAGSIGATLLAPVDAAARALNNGKPVSILGHEVLGRDDRRAEMDGGLQSMGAQPDSFMYGAGKLSGELAGTAGAGGLIGQGVVRAAPLLSRAGMAAPTIQQLATSAATGGFSTGVAPGSISALANMGVRATGGALAGGAGAAMIDPSYAGTGAAVGAALPGSIKLAAYGGEKLAGGMSSAAKGLMQSAIKPTIKQLASGDADVAVKTMLEHGINPTKAGVAKLRDLMYTKNEEIANAIASSSATVSKQKVIAALADVRHRFGNQVSPTADLRTIQSIADDFVAHPNLPGDAIPVQAAQELKKGTYKILSKKYGQIGTADTEAQKGLARGLKEEIADAVPGIQGLNAEESRLIRTLGVVERRALMDANKNPMGLAALAHSPASWAMFMADKSALFKSLAARMVNSAGQQAGKSGAALENAVANPLLRAAAPAISAASSRD